MRPNARNLAMRDPALHALLVGAQPGADFGADYSFAGGGYAFGEDQPTPENMQKAWLRQQATKRREALLEPNADSTVKVQRFGFGLVQTVTLATAIDLAMSGNPETNIRPQRITTNAPIPGFASISSIKVANVSVLVGGEVDAFDFAAQAQDSHLDVPTLSPANKVNVAGRYSGLLPDGGYVTATAFKFTMSFKGPASMTP